MTGIKLATVQPSYLGYDDLKHLVRHHSVVQIKVAGHSYVPDGDYTVRLTDGLVCAVKAQHGLVRHVYDSVVLRTIE